MPRERKLLLRGQPVALGARAFDLLVNLVYHRGRVMMKDELMMRVWPGVVVEENNLTVQVSALRKVLGAPAIATISGRGYQLTLEVSEISRRTSPIEAVQPDAVAPLALPDKPSIAVLPFANLSADAHQDHFVEGIVDDIITELSRFRSLFVIARNTTFTYKGKGVDPRNVAKELGVRYVLEGSIRRSGQRMRVTAQLVDAATGSHVWAERYERVVEEVFAVQEEVTQAIVAALAPHIEVFETGRVRVRSGNLSAYELGMRAWATAQAAFKDAAPALRDEALRLAREAIAIDPNCTAAWRSIAAAHWQDILNGTAASPARARDEGMEAARRAVAIDGDEMALACKGLMLLYGDDEQNGMSEVRRAHELNPNNAFVLAALGFIEVVTGNAAAAIEHISRAIRLSPRDPWRYVMMTYLGWGHFGMSDYRRAIDAAQAAINEAPSYAPPRLCLIVSLAGLGDMEKAKLEYQSLVAMAPEFAAGSFTVTWKGRDPDYQQRRVRFVRMAAGLDEAAACKPEVKEVSMLAAKGPHLHGQTHRQPIVLDTLLHGWTYFSLYTAEGNATARRTFESAIALADDPAEAIAMLGWTHWFDAINGWSNDSDLSFRFASECAAAAIACDRSQPTPHRLQGAVLLWRKQHAAALEHFRHAVELAPQSAYAHYNLANAAAWSGRCDEAMPHLDRALELEPNDNGLFLTVRGYALWVMGKAQEAKAALGSAITRNPTHSWAYGQLAAVHVELGDLQAAREAASAGRRLNRRFSLSYAERALPFRIPVHARRMLEAWRVAGMPQDEALGGLPVPAPPPEVARIAAAASEHGVQAPASTSAPAPFA
jgi:TolB-like protein/tetratricopeptide (TPR) repeat protein